MDLSLRIVFAKMARTLLIVVAVLIALPVVGIDLTVLSVFGGALGVGLGLVCRRLPAIMCPASSSCWTVPFALATG
jgi:small-conductance mechanosensitive channel